MQKEIRPSFLRHKQLAPALGVRPCAINDLLAANHNPEHEECAELLGWRGFDPEAFSVPVQPALRARETPPAQKPEQGESPPELRTTQAR
jgi:hypothetical protein